MDPKNYFYLLFIVLISSCVVKKGTTYNKPKGDDTISANTIKRGERANDLKADKVIEKAMTFLGTRYKYGGTTKRGMDCSGLIYVALQENNISFPRVSYQMANEGKRIQLKEVEKGNLLFFKTSKGGKRINHVGLVVDVNGGDIRFIHSTSSRGVIVSSLREGYWNHSFIKATRIL